MHNKHLYDLIDKASEIELLVSEIYQLLSNIFKENQELSMFWEIFSEAEKYHYLLVQMQKMLTPEDHTTDTREKLCLWEKEINSATTYLVSLLERLKNQHWKPSISESFSFAYDIENKSLEVQGFSLDFFKKNKAHEVLVKLHEEDSSHKDKLSNARKRFDESSKSK